MPNLPPPPEFGARGDDPPLFSPATLVHRAYFAAPAVAPESDARAILGLTTSYQAALDTVGQDPGLRQQIDILRRDYVPDVPPRSPQPASSWVDMFRGQRGAWVAVGWGLAILLTSGVAAIALVVVVLVRRRGKDPKNDSASPQEIRRVQVSQFWEREAHIEQLSPGTSSVRTSRIRIGVTEEQSHELSLNLGLPAINSVGPELTRKLGDTTRLELGREVETSIQLSNNRTGYYRRVAVWHLVEDVQVEALTANYSGLAWAPRASVCYRGSERAATSFADIAKADL